MNKFLFFALSTFTVAAHAQPIPPEAKVLSVSTFTDNDVSVTLSTFRTGDGRLCREYVRDISLSPDNKTSLSKATYCEGDAFPPQS